MTTQGVIKLALINRFVGRSISPPNAKLSYPNVESNSGVSVER